MGGQATTQEFTKAVLDKMELAWLFSFSVYEWIPDPGNIGSYVTPYLVH